MAKKRQVNETRTKQSIEKYLEEIGGYSPLSPEEEIELAGLIRKNDAIALDKLVKANLRFVISVAKEYQGQGLPLQDLISEGNLGLIKAAQRFDADIHMRVFQQVQQVIEQRRILDRTNGSDRSNTYVPGRIFQIFL